MGRKKKIIEEKEFTPSKYQENIFNFIQHDVGNLVVEAVAGSGKTSTIVRALKLIPNNKKILFCAFNKDIVNELSKKINKQENVDVRTVHSLGFLMLQRNFPKDELIINENKYRQYVMNNIEVLTSLDIKMLGYRNKFRYIDNVCKLVDYCRYNLADSIKEADILVDRHGIELLGDECYVALNVMKWGKENINEIDYTDMVWLPNTLFLKPLGLQYDFVAVDECQDLSKAQRELLLKCQRMGTRYLFLGDSSQCIYSFASADPESFNTLKALPNTTSLPLSISYRCPKNIVDFAKVLVPSIEANESNELNGEILYNVKIDSIKDGDMVLCRNNAPLIKVYNDFIRMGKKCQIRGKDIGLNLKKIVKSTHKDLLNVSLEEDGVFVRLYDSLFEARDNMMKMTGLDKHSIMNSSIMTNKIDMIKTLEVLAEGLKTSEELIDRISNTFSDRKTSGIKLSTIHKAKGLEAENVYIVCPSLMPSKSAVKDWEKEQEKNLMYVAYTRAKNKLGFIDESDFKQFTESSSDNIKIIELKVERALNKEFSHIPTSGTVLTPTSRVTPSKTLIKIKRGNNKVLSSSPRKTNGMSSSLTKRKIIKIN